MARHHIINGQKVDFTDAEEKARDAEEKAFLVEQAKTLYIEQRVGAYPPIGDQLDALWKGGDDADAMKVLVNKVKSDYPKPD